MFDIIPCCMKSTDNTIWLNNFGLLITTANNSVTKQNSYFVLPHNTEYKITLKNQHNTRTDATIYVDNTNIGTWRINPTSSITIERPIQVQKKFVLLKEGTREATNAGIGNYDSNGLIRIVFKPEVEVREVMYEQGICGINGIGAKRMYSSNMENYSFSNSSNQSFMSGVAPAATGLGNYSDQHFSQTSAITNVDAANITTINARLVAKTCVDNEVVAIRSLGKENAVPPRVNLFGGFIQF